MKNKKVVIFLTSLIVLVGGVFLINNIYQSKNKINKTKRKRQNNIAIMIKEDGATDYTKSTSKDIPKGNYTLNYEKSYCKNNGVIGDYNSTLGKVSFSFIGTDSCYLYFDYEIPSRTGYEAILLDNGNDAASVEEAISYINGKGTPNFANTATTNEGMYAAEDDLGTSYYFRGSINNNWVKFGKYTSDGPIRGYDSDGDYFEYSSIEICEASAYNNNNCSYTWKSGDDIYWRIIRINGDNTIRMIYSGTEAPTIDTAVIMTGIKTQVGTSESEEYVDSSDIKYIMGYMYTPNSQHGNDMSSYLKENIDDWYITTTLGTELLTKGLVADQIFCNDRSATTSENGTPGEIVGNMVADENYYYGAYARLLNNKLPKLICPTKKDKFTVSVNNGNGELTYPVGLITADEVAMAGGVDGGLSTTNNSSYYLYTDQNYCTGSPYYHSADTSSYNAKVHSSGSFSWYTSNAYCGVRPVISLSSDVKLTGNGTWDNVYEVVS